MSKGVAVNELTPALCSEYFNDHCESMSAVQPSNETGRKANTTLKNGF